MMCFIHYFSANRRLRETEKTAAMLADNNHSDDGVPPMVLAQRDFLRKEVKYFEQECQELGVLVLGFTVFCLICYVFYMFLFTVGVIR